MSLNQVHSTLARLLLIGQDDSYPIPQADSSKQSFSLFLRPANEELCKHILRLPGFCYKKIDVLKYFQYIYHIHKEATIGFEPMIRVLQTHALPLGYVAISSPSRTRTYDSAVNSRVLYRLSYRGIT